MMIGLFLPCSPIWVNDNNNSAKQIIRTGLPAVRGNYWFLFGVTMMPTCKSTRGLFPVVIGAAIVIASQPSRAFQFAYDELTGSFDTTVSVGVLSRASGVDRDIVAISNAGSIGPTGAIAFPVTGGVRGSAFSANFDDGNTNFQDGSVSRVLKFTSELDVAYRNVGSFVRFSGFKDFEYKGSLDRDSTLTNKAERLVADNLNLLDAYAWMKFDLGGMPGEIRAGEQVISWGESTFIQNSINVINPFDVSKLRVPGSELKEALRPIGAVFASLGVTQNISVEAYYQYDYENTELEPVGSFFSTNDFIADGGRKVQLGSGLLSDRGAFNFGTGAPVFDPDFSSVPRAADNRPDEGGQFGVSLRWFVPELNDSEFGAYYIRFHSRTPIISVTSGSDDGVTLANDQALGCAGFGPCAGAGLILSHAIDGFAQTANYFGEFREDIDLFGLSFNTELGNTGIAMQGEYSFRHDMPLQIDDAELLAAGLQPLGAGLSPLLGGPLAIPSQAANNVGTSTVIPGFIERDVSQVQMTATKIFGPVFKANQAALVSEFAVTHVHDMPDKDELRLEAPGTFTGGNPALTALGLQPVTEDASNFADATSFGYQIRGRLDYLNAVGPLNLSPRFAWRHDVTGIAPLGLSGFREDSKTITLGLTATYQNELVMDLSYTNFFGAGQHNLLNDRDFFGFSMAYSF